MAMVHQCYIQPTKQNKYHQLKHLFFCILAPKKYEYGLFIEFTDEKKADITPSRTYVTFTFDKEYDVGLRTVTNNDIKGITAVGPSHNLQTPPPNDVLLGVNGMSYI